MTESGKPGRAWSETWRFASFDEHGNPLVQYKGDGATGWGKAPDDRWAEWLAETWWAKLSTRSNYQVDGHAGDRRWRSPMTMPRFLARDRTSATNPADPGVALSGFLTPEEQKKAGVDGLGTPADDTPEVPE